jgi:hypothetical protein
MMEYDAHQNGRAIISLLYRRGLRSVDAILAYIYGEPDRRRDFRLLECAVARKYKMLLWDEVPPEFLTKHDLLKVDHGIDCVSPDGLHAIQVKWRRPGVRVPHGEISKFYMNANGNLHAKVLTIVTSEGVKLAKSCAKCIKHSVLSNDEFVATLCEVYLNFARFVALPVPVRVPTCPRVSVPARIYPRSVALRKEVVAASIRKVSYNQYIARSHLGLRHMCIALVLLGFALVLANAIGYA